MIESGGHLIVVDSNVPAGYKESPLLDFFRARPSEKRNIDFLVITHPDRDHYRGLVDVLRLVEESGGVVRRAGYCLLHGDIKKEIDEQLRRLKRCNERLPAAESKETSLQRQVRVGLADYQKLTACLERAETFENLVGYQILNSIGVVHLTLLGPTGTTYRNTLKPVFDALVASWTGQHLPRSCPANALSAILHVKIGGSTILLTGDMEHEEWTNCLNDHSHRPHAAAHFQPADVVKAPHHGSRTGTSTQMWQTSLKPEGCVVISAGHQHGHPHPETTDDIRNRLNNPDRLYCTNVCSDHREAFLSGGTLEQFHRSMEERRAKPCVPYHGGIAFDVYEDGVRVRPDIATPQPACPRHQPAGSVI